MEKLTELLMTNPTLTRGSHRARRLQKVIRTMVQVQKKTDGNSDQVIDYKPFVDERKPSSMMAIKVNLHNGEHTLIPVTVKMIHSAVRDCERFILKDGRLLHMVKLVGAVRIFRVYDKHVQIDLEDGTKLVRVIFWWKQKECMAQHCLIDECNGNRYIRVIGEVAVWCTPGWGKNVLKVTF